MPAPKFGNLEYALVQRVLKPLTRLELWLLRRGNINFLACPRISALTSGAVGDREGAETDQANIIALLESASHGIQYRVDSLRGIRFGNTRVISDRGNEIVLVHVSPPMWRQEKFGRCLCSAGRRTLERCFSTRQSLRPSKIKVFHRISLLTCRTKRQHALETRSGRPHTGNGRRTHTRKNAINQ